MLVPSSIFIKKINKNEDLLFEEKWQSLFKGKYNTNIQKSIW